MGLEDINNQILSLKLAGVSEVGQVSDGYHTFDELYEFRALFHALLLNEWKNNSSIKVEKSRRQQDGSLCDNGDFFIVVAQLPSGQISNHYPMKYWDYFKITESEKVTIAYDGHSSSDVLRRMKSYIKSQI